MLSLQNVKDHWSTSAVHVTWCAYIPLMRTNIFRWHIREWWLCILHLAEAPQEVWLINPSHHVHNGQSTIVRQRCYHYTYVIMGTIASQITNLTTVYSDADQRKYPSSASMAFVRGIHRRPVNSPHKWPVTRKMFPVDDVFMIIP